MKNLILANLIGSGLIFLSSAAFANGEWVEAGQTDEAKYFINYQSIKEVSVYGVTMTQAWIKMVIYNDISKDGLSKGDYSMMLEQMDCSNETMGLKAITNYKKNGRVIGNSNSRSYTPMNEVIPGSVGQDILKLSCIAIEYKNSN